MPQCITNFLYLSLLILSFDLIYFLISITFYSEKIINQISFIWVFISFFWELCYPQCLHRKSKIYPNISRLIAKQL